MSALLEWHANLVASRPRRTLLALLAVTLGAVLCLPKLEIESDLTALLPWSHPSVRLFRALENDEASRSMWLLLRGDELVRDLPAIEASLAASPFLDEVDAGPKGPERASLDRATPAMLARVTDALEPEARRAALDRTKTLLAQDPIAGPELAQRDPFGLRWILDEARAELAPPGLDLASGYLVWPEREMALLRVRGKREPFDLDFSNALLDDLGGRLGDREWEALGGYDVARRDSTRIRGDMTRSLGWSIPLLFLALVLSTRSWIVPHLYVLPTLLAVLWALGFGGALVGPLTPLAVGSAAILMGLGVDFCIHYLDRYTEERRSGSHLEAVLRAHRGTGRALFLGMLTTLVAFASLALGSFPGTGGFGILLSLGLLCAWVAALTCLPLLARLGWTGNAEPPKSAVSLAKFARSRTAGVATFVGGALALTGWIAAFSGGLRFDADPGFLRPPAERFATRAAELDAALGASPTGLRLLIPEERDPYAIATAVEDLVERGVVARADGPLAAVAGARRRTAQQRFLERTRDWRTGAEADLAAAGFRVEPFAATLDELGTTLSLSEPFAEAPDVTWEEHGYRSLVLYPPQTPSDVEERRSYRAAVTEALGTDVLVVDPAGLGDTLGPLLRSDLMRSLGVSAPFVALIVLLALGFSRASLAALIPVFAGLGITLGGLVLWDFPLHPGNLLALPLILGLGVDDGIHMVLRSREGDGDPLLSTGRSIWRTTITTGIGFGSLLFAQSPAIASLGGLAAAGALVCFLATVLAVPRVLGR